MSNTSYPSQYPQLIMGSMYQVDENGAGGNDITVAAAGTYYGWTTATQGHIEGGCTFENNATADRIYVPKTGHYRTSTAFSYSGSANAVIKCRIYKNGVLVTESGWDNKIGPGGDVVNSHGTSVVEWSAGDYADVRFTSNGNGDVINFWRANFSIIFLGE